MKPSARMLALLLAMSAAPVAILACSGDDSEDVEDAEGAARGRKKSVSLYDKLQTKLPPEAPDGGSYNNLTEDKVPDVVAAAVPLDVDRVVKAMQKVKDSFYPETGPAKYSSPAGYQPDLSEPEQCYWACPSAWSDLVCQFYCGFPGYTPGVSENIHACFSDIARGYYNPGILDKNKQVFRGQGKFGFVTYSMIYAYCLYGEANSDTSDGGAEAMADAGTSASYGFDFGLYGSSKEFPLWDEEKALANKKSNRKLGVLKWVDDNIKSEFQYVMYTWYNPFAFTMKSQQEALNKLYGVQIQKHDYTVADTTDVPACINSKRKAAPYDPKDGTHCSSAKKLSFRGQPAQLHRNYDNIVKAMKALHPQ